MGRQSTPYRLYKRANFYPFWSLNWKGHNANHMGRDFRSVIVLMYLYLRESQAIQVILFSWKSCIIWSTSYCYFVTVKLLVHASKRETESNYENVWPKSRIDNKMTGWVNQGSSRRQRPRRLGSVSYSFPS